MVNFRKIAAPVLLTAGLMLGAPAVAKTDRAVGTISIDETQFGFLVGGSTGGGKLHFHGTTYPFKIGGLSVGDIGVSKVKGAGHVYHMTSVAQFPGNYTKLDASATLGAGKGAIQLKNEHGVVLEVDTMSKGLQLSAGAGGVKITMK